MCRIRSLCPQGRSGNSTSTCLATFQSPGGLHGHCLSFLLTAMCQVAAEMSCDPAQLAPQRHQSVLPLSLLSGQSLSGDEAVPLAQGSPAQQTGSHSRTSRRQPCLRHSHPKSSAKWTMYLVPSLAWCALLWLCYCLISCVPDSSQSPPYSQGHTINLNPTFHTLWKSEGLLNFSQFLAGVLVKEPLAQSAHVPRCGLLS